jgi:hypothetical protein
MAGPYVLDTPRSNSPLDTPSHSALHGSENAAIHDLHTRVKTIEDSAAGTASAIQLARRAAHEWALRGPIMAGDQLLLPILWNITGQPVLYDALKATVFTPPQDSDIIIDIVNGAVLAGDKVDYALQHSILSAGELRIPLGQFTSNTISGTGFAGDATHGVNTYVAAVIKQSGGNTQPGADLTIQLNRLL